MPGGLKHGEIRDLVMALGEAKLINLDASVRNFLEPVAQRIDPESQVGLHVLCCNEYALVTGLVGGAAEVIR